MNNVLLYFIVLISAIAHASWNALLKNSGDRLLLLSSIRVVGLLSGSVVAALVPLPSIESLPYLLSAACVHFLYFSFMLNSYRLGDMSQVYPISRGIAPVLVLALGVVFANERLSGAAFFSVFVLSSGIAILAFSGNKLEVKALMYALATGTTIAGYSFLSGMGIRKTESAFSYIAWLEIIIGSVMTVFSFHRRKMLALDFARTNWRTGLSAGLLSVIGFGIAVWAMSKAAMAPVVALRETSVVFAAIIGAVFLKEGFARTRVAASLVVASGVVILGWSAR